MTVSSTVNREQYATDGVTTAFTIHFPFFNDTDVNAVFVDALGNTTTLALNADFTVSGGGGAGGSLVANTAPEGGGALTIYREIPFTQEDDYVENDPLPADTLEGGFDRAVMRDQQLKDSQDRALTFPVTIASDVSAVLPNPSPDTYLGWNATGDALENKTLPDGTTVYASIANTRAGTSAAEAVTPDGLASLWQEGANALVSAASIAKPSDANLGGFYTQTGNTATNAYWAGAKGGEEMEIRYTGTPTLGTSGNLVPPGGASYAVAAGTAIRWRWDASQSKWRAVAGMTADGKALIETPPPAPVIAKGSTGSMNNGTAIGFTPPNNAGKIVFATSGTAVIYQGEAYYYVPSGVMLAGTVGANFAVNATDGTLTGTTGSVGNVTIRCNSADGKIYVENRSGTVRSLTYYTTA